MKEASWKMVFARDKEEFDAVWRDKEDQTGRPGLQRRDRGR